MVFNCKFRRIIITGLLTGLLAIPTAFATSEDTKVTLDKYKAELQRYSEMMENAHAMAEAARALGYTEESSVIIDAQAYWQIGRKGYDDTLPIANEWQATYDKEYAAEQEAKQNSKGRYIGKAKITAYTPSPSENAGYSVTATGAPLSGNEWAIVAGDPSYWKYGTKFRIEGLPNTVTMLDCGGAIKGSNRFDLLVPIGQANSWGIQYRDVWVIE